MRKDVIFLLFIVSMSFGIMNASANSPDNKQDLHMSPDFIAIISCINDLTLNSGGMLTCEGETLVNSAYNAGLTMELQQYKNGNWQTIKTWNESAWQYVYLGYNWYVAKGYSYRLQLTHTALNGDTVIESVVKYSRTVAY